VNAWPVLAAPADRDQADPVRADLGRPEHPAGPQAPEWHPLRSPPSCSTYCSTTLPCQIPPSAEQVPSGALGTGHRTVSVTTERVSLGAAQVLAGGRVRRIGTALLLGDALGFVAFAVPVLWEFSHTNIGWD
jgi:hypothetical protein